MKYLVYLLWIVIAIVLVTVALANPEMVHVNLTPSWLGGIGLTMPLFAHIYIALFVGVALGLFIEYLREARFRRVARKAKRELKKTNKQLEKTKKDAGQHDDDVLAIMEQ